MSCPSGLRGTLRQSATSRWTAPTSNSCWKSRRWIPPGRCSDERRGSHGWRKLGRQKGAEEFLVEKSRRFVSVSRALSWRDGPGNICPCRGKRGAKHNPAGHRRPHGHSRGKRQALREKRARPVAGQLLVE